MELARPQDGLRPSRQWVVLVAGAMVTAFGVLLLSQATGVYWTRYDVELTPPPSGNAIVGAQEATIAMAGVVVAMINGGPPEARVASTDATLYGQGLREGASVRLKDTGGQWLDAYAAPIIEVEVVGGSEADVRETSGHLYRSIEVLLEQRQSTAGVAPRDRITATDYHLDPGVFYVAGSRLRAASAGLGLGVLGTANAALIIQLRRRRSFLMPSHPASAGLGLR